MIFFEAPYRKSSALGQYVPATVRNFIHFNMRFRVQLKRLN